MTPRSPAVIRSLATGFAVVLGLQAAWIVTAELIRPRQVFFPANAMDAKSAIADNSAAATAAWIGWPRGDLWADYAVTANAGMIGSLETAASDAQSPNQAANSIAATAAALAPSDARAWVLLAMNAQSASNDAKSDSKNLAPLRMSYYTSPYSDDLFPLRIQIATRSSAINDEELGIYAEYELGVAIRNKPALKPAIALAYRNASPAGRAFIEGVLAKLDANYLSELKSKP
jgi:hypothetical protein